jgi:hypothetical protein
VELNKEIMGMMIQIIHTYSTTLVIVETAGSYHVYGQKHSLYFRCFFLLAEQNNEGNKKKIQFVYTDSLKNKYSIFNIQCFQKTHTKKH